LEISNLRCLERPVRDSIERLEDDMVKTDAPPRCRAGLRGFAPLLKSVKVG
jgi:hypothetical protein